MRRRYVRQIRAILHAWSKYGETAAEREHHAKYYKKHRWQGKRPPLAQIVSGKLAYLAMVRGLDDGIYRKLETEFAHLSGRHPRIPAGLPAVDLNDARSAVWVVETKLEKEEIQGSGFMLEGVGLVTCAHCVGPRMLAFRPPNTQEKYEATVQTVDDDLDLAILKIEAKPVSVLRAGTSASLEQLDPVYILGYPEYADGASVHMDSGHITGWRAHFGTRRMIVNTALVHGNSGGPVLDSRYRVVGVAAKGRDDKAEAYWNSVIPIERVRDLKPRQNAEAAAQT